MPAQYPFKEAEKSQLPVYSTPRTSSQKPRQVFIFGGDALGQDLFETLKTIPDLEITHAIHGNPTFIENNGIAFPEVSITQLKNNQKHCGWQYALNDYPNPRFLPDSTEEPIFADFSGTPDIMIMTPAGSSLLHVDPSSDLNQLMDDIIGNNYDDHSYQLGGLPIAVSNNFFAVSPYAPKDFKDNIVIAIKATLSPRSVPDAEKSNQLITNSVQAPLRSTCTL